MKIDVSVGGTREGDVIGEGAVSEIAE